jgi:hypothetical protein
LIERRAQESFSSKDACRAIASATAGEGAKFKDIKRKRYSPQRYKGHKDKVKQVKKYLPL